MSHQVRVELRAAQPYAGIRRASPWTACQARWTRRFPNCSAGWPPTTSRPPGRRSSATSSSTWRRNSRSNSPSRSARRSAARARPARRPAGRPVRQPAATGPYDGLIASNAALQEWAQQQESSSTAGHPSRLGVARPGRALPDQSRCRTRPREWEVDVAYLAL